MGNPVRSGCRLAQHFQRHAEPGVGNQVFLLQDCHAVLLNCEQPVQARVFVHLVHPLFGDALESHFLTVDAMGQFFSRNRLTPSPDSPIYIDRRGTWGSLGNGREKMKINEPATKTQAAFIESLIHGDCGFRQFYRPVERYLHEPNRQNASAAIEYLASSSSAVREARDLLLALTRG